MLTDLTVTDLGVIEQAEVGFETGSTALTGETGAGKTLVVAALGLLLGQRADRSLVRAGMKRARVQGRWQVAEDHPVIPILIRYDLIDLPTGQVELIATRSIEAEGSSKARINGRMVPAKVLDEVCGSLVEITGQHLHQRITDPAWQRSLLDQLGGEEAVRLAGAVRASVAEARAWDRRAEELASSARERVREIAALRSEIDEITSAGLRVGESAELRMHIARLENAEVLAASLQSAAASLDGERGAAQLVGDAERDLRDVLRIDEAIAEQARRLESVRHEIADIAGDLKSRVTPPDEFGLNEARERVAEIARLGRKYGESEEEILRYASEAATQLQGLENEEGDASEAIAKAERLWVEARTAAEALSGFRSASAAELMSLVQEKLVDLAMREARFEVDLQEVELAEGGLERPSFRLSANPGEPVRPLGKVASGGELSRVALALRLVAGRTGVRDDRCMVFDEVDAGVGGAAARSVGRCLAELGRASGAQVVVVTHLPQVAACADHHLKVSKGSSDSATRAHVVRLEGEARVEEISRMLAGLPESARAQDHARELLEEKVG